MAVSPEQSLYKTNLDEAELNPFIVNNPLEVVAIPKGHVVRYVDTLSTPLDRLNQTHYLQDSQNKVTVYRYSKSIMFEVIFGRLSDKSRSLFLYIIYSLNKDEDYILLSSLRVQRDIGMSRRTLSGAIKELKACSIIAMRERSIYWVNPMYIFNGNRIEFYKKLNPDNLIVKSILK